MLDVLGKPRHYRCAESYKNFRIGKDAIKYGMLGLALFALL